MVIRFVQLAQIDFFRCVSITDICKVTHHVLGMRYSAKSLQGQHLKACFWGQKLEETLIFCTYIETMQCVTVRGSDCDVNEVRACALRGGCYSAVVSV